jgi:hypothetical protein
MLARLTAPSQRPGRPPLRLQRRAACLRRQRRGPSSGALPARRKARRAGPGGGGGRVDSQEPAGCRGVAGSPHVPAGSAVCGEFPTLRRRKLRRRGRQPCRARPLLQRLSACGSARPAAAAVTRACGDGLPKEGSGGSDLPAAAAAGHRVLSGLCRGPRKGCGRRRRPGRDGPRDRQHRTRHQGTCMFVFVCM